MMISISNDDHNKNYNDNIEFESDDIEYKQ